MTLSHTDQPDVASQPRGADPNGSVGCQSALLVADAVLYEGYLLYPYRVSSEKNRVRWQFGVLAPRDWIETRGPASESVSGSADAWRQRTECLLEARASTRLWVRLRFLQLQHRSVQQRGADGKFVEVDALDVDGQRHDRSGAAGRAAVRTGRSSGCRVLFQKFLRLISSAVHPVICSYWGLAYRGAPPIWNSSL